MEENNEKAEIYSQRVRAGKRTYFFDVKSTRSNDYYVTITESKRKFNEDNFSYEKHKIFLYKEDFAKFIEALQGTIDHVKSELLTEEALAALETPPAADTEAEVTAEVATTPAFDEELKWE
ncbi:PUR family DNA/RNA-binding protein [Pontibacter sp. 172403-2]|uniref:DUF3276 family protein n=1 Tax=Pontibacter rufus TaxID=2791028 RepID=UPI0018B015C7|nr:PUR family DNA/RNA-binding protein [Pontibacter sp. 172403-2]